MAYSAVPTVTTGDSWSAANHNTYIRDNFAAGVPDIFTAAGDLAYATAANAASPLAIGSSDQSLSVVSGLPAWSYGPGMVLLESQTISTTDTTEVIFSTIDQAFTHLKIEMDYIAPTTDLTPVRIQLNGASSSTYYTEYQVRLDSRGTFEYYSYSTYGYFGVNVIFSASGDSAPNKTTLEIFNYINSTQNKNGKLQTYYFANSVGYFITDYLRYLDTTSVTQIRLYIDQTGYPGRYIMPGSSFQLYGIR